MNVNPANIIQWLKQSDNPKQLCFNLLRSMSGNNPFFANLISLGEQGKQDEIVKIARNALKEQGRDFDEEFKNFRNNLGF